MLNCIQEEMSALRDKLVSDDTANNVSAWLDAGFRPFYLLGSGFAVVTPLLWAAIQLQWIRVHHIDLMWWGHEIVFGSIAAVSTGFLYSIAREWTKLDPARGLWLALIAGVWVAGRTAILFEPTPVSAAVDCAFLFLAPLPLHRILKFSRMRKHIVLVELICVLALLNFLYHLAVLGMSQLSASQVVDTAAVVSVILATACIQCCVRDHKSTAESGTIPYSDKLTLWLLALSGTATLAGLTAFTAALAFPVAIALAIRQPWNAMHIDRGLMHWILYCSNFWVPLGFVWLGLANLGMVKEGMASHLIILGLASNSILRMLTSIEFSETVQSAVSAKVKLTVFTLVQVALLGYLLALVVPVINMQSMILSAVFWSSGFSVYLVFYLPHFASSNVRFAI